MDDINRYIDDHKGELVSLLRELVVFPSEKKEASEGKPFGPSVDECYRYYMKLAEDAGFDIYDADGWGGHYQMPGAELDDDGNVSAAAERTLGIPVHLDVVPAGSGWTGEPFSGDVKDGRVYGRGTTDNKDAAASIFMALKALKECGFTPRTNVRVIIGLDEETGWSGMGRYLEAAGSPDFGFTPDADFPAINGEMGILVFEIAKKLSKANEKGLNIRSLEGGSAANMVADSARAVLMDDTAQGYAHLKERIEEFRKRSSYKVNGKGIGKAFEISVQGKSAHGSRPELGVNAISVLMELLSEIEPANESVREFIDFYRAHIGYDLHGERMGIGLCDEASGKLIFNVGMISMDAEAVILTINVRYPVTMDGDTVYGKMLPLIHENDLGLVKIGENEAIYFPADDTFIEKLMGVYRVHTGDENAKPLVIGGGTYARAIPNAVAFGPKFPGTPGLEHQADEYKNIDELVLMTKIYADAIRVLCGKDGE